MIGLLLSEFRRELRIWWSYRLNAVLEIIIYTIVLSVLMSIFGAMAQRSGATYDIHEQAASIIGVLVWHLCMQTMAQFSTTVKEEAETGTLEAVLISPISPLAILTARAATMSTIRGIQTLIMGLAFILILQLQLHFSLLAIVVILLTLIGVCGMGIAFAGITLVHKQTNSIVSLVSTLAVFAAGSLVPINSLNGLFTILKLLFPLTWGTDILRRILIDNQGLETNFLVDNLAGLAAQATLMVILGAIVFKTSLNRARREATLATY